MVREKKRLFRTGYLIISLLLIMVPHSVKAATLKLNCSSSTLTVGQQKVIGAVSSSSKVKWTTSNSKVVSIVPSGKKVTLKAKGIGQATITCKVGNVKKYCKVKVYPKPSYAGSYEGTYCTLEIRKSSSSRYWADLSIIRLCTIDNLKCTLENGILKFYGYDPAQKPIRGTIRKVGNKVTLKITNTTWAYFKNGDTYVLYE